MLSDAEQRRLTEIESGLRSEDPAFVKRFGGVVRRSPRRRLSTSTRGWLIAAALVMGLAVLMASVVMVVIALSVAAVSAALWLTDDSRTPDDRRPPRQ